MKRKEIFQMMNGADDADLDALPNLSGFEDSDVIHSYTRAEAIADGVLINVSKEAKELGITFDTAVTPGVWAELIGNERWAGWGSETDRLKRLLSDSCNELEKTKDGCAHFTIRMTDEGAILAEIPIRAVMGDGDKLETVLTVMLGHED